MVKSGITHYRVGKDIGISPAALDRFVASERAQLQSNTIDKLCDYFGLELRKKTDTSAKKQPAKKKRTTPKRTAKKKR